MKRLPELDQIGLSGCFIAGGSVLSTVTKTDINDYDIYPKTKKDTLEVCQILFDFGCWVVNHSSNAITFKSNIVKNGTDQRVLFQVVLGEYPTAKSIFDVFDFTICMGAYDCDTKEYSFHDDFWVDVAAKNLRYNPNTRYPLNSLFRIRKYTQRGYNIGKTEQAKLALSIAQRGMPNSWEELEDAIGGIYGKTVNLKRGDTDLPFTYENALTVLEDVSIDTLYEDLPDMALSQDDVEALLSDEQITVYEFQSKYYVIENDWISPYTISRKFPEKYIIKQLTDRPFIKGGKALKKTPTGEFVGGVYHGAHNGVTYKSFEKTIYAEKPYLFAYHQKDRMYSHLGDEMHYSEVVISTSDIVAIDNTKINTKSIFCGEIHKRELPNVALQPKMQPYSPLTLNEIFKTQKQENTK